MRVVTLPLRNQNIKQVVDLGPRTYKPSIGLMSTKQRAQLYTWMVKVERNGMDMMGLTFCRCWPSQLVGAARPFCDGPNASRAVRIPRL